MSFVFCIWSLFIFGVTSQQNSCSDGYVTSNDNDVCVVDCYNSDLEIPLSEASYDLILEACYSLREITQLYPTQCNSMDDLVFPDYCTCPKCKCTEQDKTGEIFDIARYVEYECLNCTCQAASSWYGFADGTLIYDCDTLTEAWSPGEFESYSCPPNICTVSYTPSWSTTERTDDRTSGELWLSDVADEATKCETVCRCDDDGNTQCAEGWIDILNNDDLKVPFQIECVGEIADCLNDPTRMFGVSYGPDCYNSYWYDDACPRCDCGDYSLSDEWYTAVTNPYSGEEICVSCVCREIADGLTYADCNDDLGFYFPTDGECGDDQLNIVTHQCHENGWTSDSTLGTLNSVECTNWYIGDQAPPSFCEISYDPDDEGYEWNWDCGDDYISFCEAFGSGNDDECFMWDVTMTLTDPCDGSTDIEEFRGYRYCCIGENCNYKTLDTSSCTTSTAYENLIRDVWQCQSQAVSGTLKAAVCDDIVDDITCSGIEQYYRHSFDCICPAYADIYERLGAASKTKLQAIMDELTSTSARYNTEFGCSIRLRCNLASGGTVVNLDAGQRYNVYGAFMVVLVVLMMYYK